MTDHSERDEDNWRKVRDKLAGDWFKDWDDRLNHEELRPFFSAYRYEREEATRHFDAGWSSAIANDPRVLKLVEAAKEVLEAEVEKNERERRKLGLKEGEHIISGNWRCNISFRELERALTEWSKP